MNDPDRSLLERMVKDLVETLDYDLSKQLDPETAEEPEFADELLEELVAVAHKHLDSVLNDAAFLKCLKAVGVDNWCGYSEAHERLNEQGE